jgi:tetratricopeptide (TPR) repeat protein
MLSTHSKQDFTSALIFFLALAVIWFAYTPGLSGTFLFDDFVNLPALGDFGPVDNWKTFFRYITSGNADPLGRPMALLSFLIDAQDWPAAPYPFKRTSVLLHLLNGCFLARCLFQLGRYRLQRTHAMRAAIVGASLWLAHPLWISTTLYIVQREAMLPATFCFAGLSCYLAARETLDRTRSSGFFAMLACIIVFTLLAVLSKANGLLFPCLIGVLEITYLRQTAPLAGGTPFLSRLMRYVIFPSCVLATAIVIYYGVSGMLAGLPVRPWTEWQRVITEPRVLWDYLSLLLVPHPYSRGIFNDSFVASTNLLHPWTTLPAMLGIVVLIVCAYSARRFAPALSAALLFFFVGHSIESTTLPLELYFEHRNYLPAGLLFWPVSVWLTSGEKRGHLKYVACFSLFVLLSAETYAGASLWGDTESLALVWARQNPDSPRAQSFAASAERSAGKLDAAEKRLRAALSKQPDEAQLVINLLGVTCDKGLISPADIRAAEYALTNGTNRGPLSFDWIASAINLASTHACAGLTLDTVNSLVRSLEENKQAKANAGYRQEIANLQGQLQLAKGDVPAAEKVFASALQEVPKPDVALKQAAMLGAQGHAAAGLAQLKLYQELVPEISAPSIRNMASLHQWILFHDGFWNGEFAHLHQALSSDLDAQSKAADFGSGVNP